MTWVRVCLFVLPEIAVSIEDIELGRGLVMEKLGSQRASPPVASTARA